MRREEKTEYKRFAKDGLKSVGIKVHMFTFN